MEDFCGKCGAKVISGTKFCQSCGAPVADSMNSTATNNNTADVAKDGTQKKKEGTDWINLIVRLVIAGLLCGWLKGCASDGGFPYKSNEAIVERFNSTLESTFAANNVSGANSYKLPSLKNWSKNTPNAKTEVYFYQDGANEYEIRSTDRTRLFKITTQAMINGNQNACLFANAIRLVSDDPATVINQIRANRKEGFEGLGVYEYFDSKKGVNYEVKEVGPVVELIIRMPKK